VSDTYTDVDGTWTKMGGGWALTEPSQAWLDAREADNAALVLPPDVPGFRGAALTSFGLVRANALLAKWPTFNVALDASNFAVAQQVLDAAVAGGDLTVEEKATIVDLMTQHNIPFV